jgi:uncharacterized protein (DUF1778 family)
MAKLFQKKAISEVRSIRYPIHLTAAEAETIRHSASIRNMSVAEFMRRAALGRKADVDYDTKIVLQLSDVVRAIRAIHKQMVELQMEPPEAVWSPVMDEALDAMLRIGN